MTHNLIMVGAFPGPVHGMAAVNEAVGKLFVNAGLSPFIIDISSKSLNRSFLNRVCRVHKVIAGLIKLSSLNLERQCIIYISISGGYGQIYELFFLAIARIRKIKIVMHHHSYAYIGKFNVVTKLLLIAAGKDSINITQSANMSSKLQLQYSLRNRILSISNVVFFFNDVDLSNRVKKTSNESCIIGFISNICEEKGIYEFIELVRSLEMSGKNVKALIAGPFQDEGIRERVTSEINESKNIDYIGPVYKSDKYDFYSAIDILVFPTLYENETEGIVNHEALYCGVPVIAYGRGCIPEIIDSSCGLVIDTRNPFVSNASKQILKWIASPEEFDKCCENARVKFENLKLANMEELEGLLNEIVLYCKRQDNLG